jgi:hypothetical protein
MKREIVTIDNFGYYVSPQGSDGEYVFEVTDKEFEIHNCGRAMAYGMDCQCGYHR